MFRATWLTSVFAGAAMGVAGMLSKGQPQNFPWMAGVFFISGMFGVIGVPQMMELRALKKSRPMFSLPKKEEFTDHYFPTWGRMFIWFISAVVTSAIMQAFK